MVRRLPVLLEDVAITQEVLVDAEGRSLPLAPGERWAVLAATGGQLVRCFGEWHEKGFLPVTVEVDGRVVPCA